jgi:hypothetical protein
MNNNIKKTIDIIENIIDTKIIINDINENKLNIMLQKYIENKRKKNITESYENKITKNNLYSITSEMHSIIENTNDINVSELTVGNIFETTNKSQTDNDNDNDSLNLNYNLAQKKIVPNSDYSEIFSVKKNL